MSINSGIYCGARAWLRVAAAGGGRCTDVAGAVVPGAGTQTPLAYLSLFALPAACGSARQLSARSQAKPAVSSTSDRSGSGAPEQPPPHRSPRRRRDEDRQPREPSADVGRGDTFIRRSRSSPSSARVAAQPSAPIMPAGQPLLRDAPGAGLAPLPSLTSCPSLAVLNEHVQRYGHLYKLSHVAAGLQVLAQLVPAAAPVRGAAATPAAAPPTSHQPSSAGSHVSSSVTSSASNSNSSSSGQAAAAHEQAARSAAAEAARQAAQVADLLVLAGHHQARQEDDLASLSACIDALARTGELEASRPRAAEGQAHAAVGRGQPQPQPPRAPVAVELAMPFVERLRAPGYYYHMRSQRHDVLAQLLHALGKLRPWAYLPEAERFTFAMVVGRVVSSLHAALPRLGLEEAVAAAQAMARLHLPVRGHERNTAFLKGLARHLATDVLPSSSPSPEDAFRLVWAYGELLPGACGTDDGAYAAATTPAGPHSAPEAAAKSAADEAGAGAAPSSPQQVDRRAGRGDAADADVGALVTACCRVVRKSLGSPEPLSPRQLARVIRALGKLRARRELQELMPQAAPVLLAHLPSLDTGNLVDVAFTCTRGGVAEPGLTTAIADQIAASEGPLALGDVQRLLAAYGVRGAAPHAGVRQRARTAVAQSLNGAVPVRDLNGLLRVMDDQDAADAELVALVRARLKDLSSN